MESIKNPTVQTVRYDNNETESLLENRKRLMNINVATSSKLVPRAFGAID